jgi:DNA transposition AAA+ family ATPase
MRLSKTWPNLPTLQSKEIISALADAKENQKAVMIISDTGLGKTNCIKMFKEKSPNNTFVVTVGDSYKLEDVINEIGAMVGVEFPKYGPRISVFRMKLQLISEKLIDISNAGGNPVLILDEAENLKPSVLKTIKELYDAVIDYCGIVMIGTEQLLDSILNRKQKNRISIPQLYRRFKAGTRYISKFNKARDMKLFFEAYVPDDAGIQSLLIQHCDNYGELHDFLHPVIDYAAKKQKPLTETLFRLYHNISN